MKKRTAVITISILAALTLTFGTVAVIQTEARDKAARVNEIYGEHALGAMASALADMNETMRKSAYVTSPELLARLCAETAVRAEAALTSLEELPYSTQELEKTLRFVNAAGDYALYMSRQATRGKTPDDETEENFKMFSEGVSDLSARMTAIRQGLEDNALRLDRYGDCSEDCGEGTVGYELLDIEGNLEELPDLVYDGQYSAAAQTEDGQNISEDEARRVASLFLGVPEQRLAAAGESDQTLVPCRYFTVSTDAGEEQRIAVSKTDGAVLEWTLDRTPAARIVTDEEAARAALDFLTGHGFEGLVQESSEERDGLCVLSFVPQDGGAAALPRTVSVSVALDTGEPCALVAWNYYGTAQADLQEPAVSAEDAAATLPDTLTLQSARLSVIETDSGAQLLCYELSCTAEDDSDVTVYVDAATGKQEKIELGTGASP